MKVFHYTTIGTLALILKYKTIRLNRLDQVDDLEESMYSSGPKKQNLGKYVFISCWTKTAQENLSLWRMYAGYNGIRLSLDEDMFVSYPNAPFDTFRSFYKNIYYFGKDYMADQYTNKIELHKVNYVENPQIVAENLINYKDDSFSIESINVGLFKRKEWSMQDEYRFKIQVLPLNYKYTPNYTMERLNSLDRMGLTKANIEVIPALLRSFDEKFIIGTKYIDMPIKQDALDRIEILLGPHTTEGDRAIVESLLHDYPNSHIENSFFRNKIRKN